jgi:outer membrane protein assembly factor BamA
MFDALRSFRLYFCIFMLVAQSMAAQNSILLEVRSQDDVEDILKRYKFKQKQADSLSAIRTLNELVTSLHNDGYLIATLEKIEIEENRLIAFLSVGPPFEWIALKPGNVDPLLLRKVSYQKYGLNADRFNYQELARLEKDLLRYAERNGYPFAALKYDSLEIRSGSIGASLNLDLGPLIRFDSIRVDQNVLKRPFLESYLGLSTGDAYDEFKVERTVQLITSMPYVRLEEAPSISFQNEEATLYFDLEKRRINRIDGVIGFLPSSASDNGLLITGQFDMDLYNPFLSGKHIGIHWRSPQEQSQTLNMQYAHPNFLRTPISFQADFNFLKQDTTFTRIDFRIDVDVKVGRASQIAIFTDAMSSNLLSTSQHEDATSLPAVADIDNRLYGLSFRLNELDDPLLPKRGTLLALSGGLGNKNINPIPTVPSDLYEGVQLKSVQSRYDLNLAHYFYLKPRWNIKLNIHGGWIENENLFLNDAYRIGGLNTIRGFDENFFYASKFVINTLENRFYFESNSYLSLFSDFGLMDNLASDDNRELFLGMGAGVSFATERGIFNLVYALGTAESTGSMNFNRSKIHFGFTTRF